MDMYPTILKNQIDELNRNLTSLNKGIDKSSKTSNKLQKALIFWTKIMACAIIVQAIVIIVQIFK